VYSRALNAFHEALVIEHLKHLQSNLTLAFAAKGKRQQKTAYLFLLLNLCTRAWVKQ
jgi:hypothetical protein